MTTLRRWSRHLDPTPIEGKIIDYVLFTGRDRRWTMFIGTNVAEVLGCNIEKHQDLVKRGMISLVRRGWLRKGTNDVGQRYIELTDKFIDAAELAHQRHEVRRILGPVTWQRLNGDDKVADALHELALTMPQVKHRDCVKAAAKAFIDGTGSDRSPGDESSPQGRRNVTSQVTNTTLRLIKDERKSAP